MLWGHFFRSLFSPFLYSLSVLFMLPFCSCFYSFFFSVLLSPLFYMLLLFSLLLTLFSVMSPSFSHLFLSLFSFIFNYFLSSLFCLYIFTTSAHWLGVLSLVLCTVSPVLHVLLYLPFDCIWRLLCPLLLLDSSFSVSTYVVWLLCFLLGH